MDEQHLALGYSRVLSAPASRHTAIQCTKAHKKSTPKKNTKTKRTKKKKKRVAPNAALLVPLLARGDVTSCRRLLLPSTTTTTTTHTPDPDAPLDARGSTPLIIASGCGHGALVRFLLRDCHADPNITSADGMGARQRRERRDGKRGRQTIHVVVSFRAVRPSHTDTSTTLLTSIPPLLLSILLLHPPPYTAPLHVAVTGHAEGSVVEDIIRDLAAHGADVNARVGDGGGNTGGDGHGGGGSGASRERGGGSGGGSGSGSGLTPLLFAAGTPGRGNVVALLRWELCADPSLTSHHSR